MSATTTLRESQGTHRGATVGAGARGDTRTLPERFRAIVAGLRGRFGTMRLPAYVSAFEAEHLAALAEWSDCRTGMTGQPLNERRYGEE